MLLGSVYNFVNAVAMVNGAVFCHRCDVVLLEEGNFSVITLLGNKSEVGFRMPSIN